MILPIKRNLRAALHHAIQISLCESNVASAAFKENAPVFFQTFNLVTVSWWRHELPCAQATARCDPRATGMSPSVAASQPGLLWGKSLLDPLRFADVSKATSTWKPYTFHVSQCSGKSEEQNLQWYSWLFRVVPVYICCHWSVEFECLIALKQWYTLCCLTATMYVLYSHYEV